MTSQVSTTTGCLRQSCTGFSLALCALIAGAASAQPYPHKTIRIVSAAAAGGGNDFVSRVIGQRLAAAFGQQVLIDNRAGAAGNIAAEIAAKATPDGYTLVVVSASHATNPTLYRKLSYHPVKDFEPVTQITGQGYVFAVHLAVPAKTVEEFVAWAKSKKGGATYASSGNGQPGHLGMELLKTLGGFEAVHVTYKGGGPAMIDLVAGQVDAFLSSPPAAAPQVKAGKVRAIAVTGLHRSDLLPDVPTVAESGFPGYEVNGWNGLLAPAGTPRDIVLKLYGEISKSLKLSEVKDRLAASGLDPVASTPEVFLAYIQAEIVKWEKIIKQSGARAD
jgi:tripartite-type tricarboxylate transporter receptor subunit TctC